MTVAELQQTGVCKQNSQKCSHRTSGTRYTSNITVDELQRPESGENGKNTHVQTWTHTNNTLVRNGKLIDGSLKGMKTRK